MHAENYVKNTREKKKMGSHKKTIQKQNKTIMTKSSEWDKHNKMQISKFWLKTQLSTVETTTLIPTFERIRVKIT